MIIDKLEYHVDEAGSEERAARHMAVFLEWAARQGFLDEAHDVKTVLADPVRYVVEQVPALTESDLNDAGAAFARDQYGEYLEILNEHAIEVGVSSYEYIASSAGRQRMLDSLDEALAEFLGLDD